MITSSTDARFPLAELHAHVEGTLEPAFARELAQREGVDLGTFAEGETYRWEGFSGFLAAYDRAAALLRRPEDYRRLARDYLTRIAADGAIYSELTISPDHARASGLSPKTYLDALAQGAKDAEQASGITCRFLVVGVRHLGPEAVEDAARLAAGAAGVTGFGMAGDERLHRPRDFARAFRIAAEGGLGAVMGRLFALSEAYPDLRSNENMKQLQEELASTENKVAFARQAYNDAVMHYNNRRETFPSSVVAGAFKFPPATMFEVEGDAVAEPVKVDFAR